LDRGEQCIFAERLEQEVHRTPSHSLSPFIVARMRGDKNDRNSLLSFDLGEPERYRKDVPKAEVYVLDAGHFALDTKADEIAALVREFTTREVLKTTENPTKKGE
jgi:hypothetical protein